VSQQRYTEAIELLRDGALSLLRANQISSGADLGLLLISTLDKAGAPISDRNIGNVFYSTYYRCHGPLQMEKDDKGSTMIRMGVSG